jgi:RNA polymerase sigma-70 factor (ECF subfamily)
MTDSDPYAVLLRQCAHGDQQAFARLYQQTSGKLFAVSLKIMQVRQLAEEVLQESFINIWQKASSFDASRASAMTWMTTIVRNRALDVLRAQKSRPVEVEAEFEGIEFSSPERGPAERAHLSLAARRVIECLEQLQDKQRQSVLLAYYYGHTHEEIAETLSSPLGTVKAWVRRGLERLQQCLK